VTLQSRTKSTAIRQLWPLLAVRDVHRSVDFYQNKLGFSVAGRAEDNGRLFWCRMERGGASIMLQQADDEDGPAESWGRGVTFYFVCDDADAMHAELVSLGVQLRPVSLADYGMKQLFVPEPDGYTICFESPTERWEHGA
jgi:uncharacterized glyoxalase superfamily protein PhnB